MSTRRGGVLILAVVSSWNVAAHAGGAFVLEQAHVEKSKLDGVEVLAAACGDLDGDGHADLVLVSRAKVVWGQLRGGGFVPVREAAWSALAPRVAVPMREPLATAVIEPRRGTAGGDLYAGLTDRGGVALSRDLRAAAPLLGLPIAASHGVACALPNPQVGAFDGPAGACSGAGAASGAIDPPVARYDALATCEVLGRDGSTRSLVAARDPTGKLTARLADAQVTADGVGTALAVADLDRDGVPEIATSGNGATVEDALVVSSWQGSDLRPRLRIPAPNGVRALTVCPADAADARGLPTLVAVVGSEVWVVR